MLRHNKRDGGAKDGGVDGGVQYLKRRSSSQNECCRWEPVVLMPGAKSTEVIVRLAVAESATAATAALHFNQCFQKSLKRSGANAV